VPGLSCEFFADNADLADLVREFATLGRFKFVQISSELNRPNRLYAEPAEILAAALVSPEKPHRRQSILIMDHDQDVLTRAIVRTDGSGTLRVADQNNNWNSIVIVFGGEAGDQTLVLSDICTVGDTEKSRQLHKGFKALIWSKTVRVGPRGTPWRLMPGAIAKAKAGWRLTPDKGFVRDLDAKISPEELAAL
jgi:hypothetical protein